MNLCVAQQLLYELVTLVPVIFCALTIQFNCSMQNDERMTIIFINILGASGAWRGKYDEK